MKVGAVAESANQADSLLRPFWRRFRRMARPARVRIRRRNPCLRDRRRLLGWNVLFIGVLLSAARRWRDDAAPVNGRLDLAAPVSNMAHVRTMSVGDHLPLTNRPRLEGQRPSASLSPPRIRLSTVSTGRYSFRVHRGGRGYHPCTPIHLVEKRAHHLQERVPWEEVVRTLTPGATFLRPPGRW